jgi:hypothetical protein
MGRLTLDIGMATISTTTTNIGYTVRANSLSFTGTVHVKVLNLSPNQLKVQSSLKSRFNRLDIGEGKEVNIDDHCPRWKMLQQCIRYLGPVSAPTLTPMNMKSQQKRLRI